MLQRMVEWPTGWAWPRCVHRKTISRTYYPGVVSTWCTLFNSFAVADEIVNEQGWDSGVYADLLYVVGISRNAVRAHKTFLVYIWGKVCITCVYSYGWCTQSLCASTFACGYAYICWCRAHTCMKAMNICDCVSCSKNRRMPCMCVTKQYRMHSCFVKKIGWMSLVEEDSYNTCIIAHENTCK